MTDISLKVLLTGPQPGDKTTVTSVMTSQCWETTVKRSTKILVGLSAAAVLTSLGISPALAAEKGQPTAITSECIDAVGNTIPTASNLEYGSAVDEPINCSADVDYWKFTLANDTAVQLQLSQLPSDYDLYLQRGDGSIIAYGVAAGRSPENVQVQLGQGTYFVRVFPYVYSDANAAVNYHLSIGQTADRAGDRPSDATALPESGVVDEAIDSDVDIDFWKFDVSESSDVNLTLTNLPADYDLYVYQQSTSGQLSQVGLGYNGGTRSEDVTILGAAPGKYYAEVRRYAAAVPGVPYRLTVTKTKRPNQPSPTPTPTPTPTDPAPSPTPTDPAPAPTNPCIASTAGQGATWVVATDGSVKKSDVASAGGENITKLGAIDTFVASLTTAEASALARDDGVVAVERNKPVTLDATQNDATWGLDRIDQTTSQLDGSYTYPGTGQGVSAYIIDTGVRATHTEFEGRVNTGYSAFGGTANDDQGHGTHVAGTVAGRTYGVAKSATIIPVKVLDSSGSGCTNSVVAGLNWATNNHQPGQPAVANMSLGGGSSTTIDLAVAQLVADGVTVAVAAGNSGDNACYYSPARAASALTVAATDRTDTRASFSNYGSCVDLFAPGVAITSSTNASDTSSATWSGTSMATPHVAGAAAVYLSLYPTKTPAEVADAMIAASTKDVVRDAQSVNRLLIVNDYAAPAPAPAQPVTTPAPATPGNSAPNNSAPGNTLPGNSAPVAAPSTPSTTPGATNGSSRRPDVLQLARPVVEITSDDITVRGKKISVKVAATGATKGTKAVLERNGKVVGRSAVDGSSHVKFKNVPAKSGSYRVVIMQGSSAVASSNSIKFLR